MNSLRHVGSIYYFVAAIVTGFSWQSGLQLSFSFWLAVVFFIVAIIAKGPKSPYSCKKFVFWITNKPFREPYHERANHARHTDALYSAL